MNQELLFYILAGLGSLAPFSLIGALGIPRFFLKFHGKLAETTSICTPITGVLTKKPVEVKTLFFDKFKARAESSVHESHKFKLLDIQSKLEIDVKRTELQKEFALNIMAITTCLCHYEKLKNIEEITAALFKSCAIDLKRIREEYQIITKISSGEEKKISTTIAVNGKTREISAFSKGNSYKILEKCTRELIDGKKEPIDHQRRHKLKKRIEKMVKKGQKVIAFAYKQMPIKRLENYSEQLCENDMVLVGFIGLVENINTELIPYIEEIKKNKIKIYIISRVKEKKAIAIAQEMKIVNPNYFETIDGTSLRSIENEKLEKMLANREKDYVFCDITPDQNFKIVAALEKNGETVTFASPPGHLTGPPGHSIKELLEYINRNRKSEKNNGKLIAHALNSKIAEIGLLLAALILQAPLPFSLQLIVIVDILINIILELALNKDASRMKYAAADAKILNPELLIRGLISILTLGGIYFWNLLRFGWIPGDNIARNTEAYMISSTMVFILLILIQIILAFEIKKAFSNIYVTLTTLVCMLILNAITSYPTIEKALGLTALSGKETAMVYFSAFIFLLLMEGQKALIRLHENSIKEIPAHQSDSEEPDE